jgi:hypothetical protein
MTTVFVPIDLSSRHMLEYYHFQRADGLLRNGSPG